MIQLSVKRVLHVLANSAPDVNGYAIRTHDLLVSLRDQDICQPIALTSPFYPERKAMSLDAEIDGIKYIRTVVRSNQKIHSKRKINGFKLPDETILPVRLFKFTTHKIRLTLRKVFMPIYRKIILFRRFLGDRRMMKRYEKRIIEQAIEQNDGESQGT